jgi:membrane protein YdbS with pleckstrin-like domain
MPDIYISDNKKKPEVKKASESTSTPKEGKVVNKKKSKKYITETGKLLNSKKSRHKLVGHTHNPLSAFFYLPEKVNFETREKKEKVVLLLRRHFVTNIKWIFLSIVMLFAPLILVIFPLITFLPGNYQFIVVLIWYLITIAYILESFLNWFFNVNIVTDERIVDIDFHNLIYKEVSDAKIERIQDVTYKMGGVLRTVFNYGDVFIQTAAEVPSFEFLGIPKPDQVAKVLQDLMMEEEQEKIEGRVR